MNRISSRPYADEKDLQIIIDLIRVRPNTRLNDYPVKMDIEEGFAQDVVRENTRLWFENEQPIGWAFVDGFNNLLWELDNEYREQVGIEIVEWGETCIRKKLGIGETAALDAACREDCMERVSFLKQHGFHPLDDFTVSMSRSLSEPIPEPVLPPGFSIRPLTGKMEADSVAAMHRAAFGTEYMTTENRLVIMSTSEYDPSLDLVAIAPDGSIAGNCICSVNEVNKIGHTDPVATHPEYQRMGLAQALLLTGMRLLKHRGMKFAHLGTAGDNVAMQKTAESVGFTVEYKTTWFSKEVN